MSSGSTSFVRPRLAYDSIRVSTAPIPSPDRRTKPCLKINIILEAELIALFSGTQGYGPASARRIIAERESGGLFRNAQDMVRVGRVSYTRLATHFSVSFAPFAPPPAQLPSCVERCVEISAANAVAAKLSALSVDSSQAAEKESDVVFVTFNCCRMSPRVPSFESKLLCIQRLVADTPGVSLLCFQELFGNSSGRIAQRLQDFTGEDWSAVGCGSDASCEKVTHAHQKTYGSSCNAAVFRTSHLRLLAHAYASGPFKRAPHVCVFEDIRQNSLPNRKSRLLAVANVHVSYRQPGLELPHLGSLLSAIHLASARCFRIGNVKGLRREHVVTVLLGDFNKAACAGGAHFQSVIDAGFIELVSSNSDDNPGDDSVSFLTGATSVAGNMLDNIFISRNRRSELVDAWIYQPGGAGRRLGESGPKSAGRLRSERSDHLPIVAQLRLGAIDASYKSVEKELGDWNVKQHQFEVDLK